MRMINSILCMLCLCLSQSLFAEEALSKDKARGELRQSYQELRKLKKEYNRIVSEIRSAKHIELLAVEKKFMASMGPITKAMETHPDLKSIRDRRDKADKEMKEAMVARDEGKAQAARAERTKAKNELYKVAYKHDDIIPLIKAREAAGKEREQVKRKLVAEKNPTLVSKMEAIEKRQVALKKIIHGK